MCAARTCSGQPGASLRGVCVEGRAGRIVPLLNIRTSSSGGSFARTGFCYSSLVSFCRWAFRNKGAPQANTR